MTLAAMVVAVRREGVDRSVLQAMARMFGKVSWTAMGVAVATGAWLSIDFIDDPGLAVKLGSVVLTVLLAGYHQLASSRQTPRTRGIFQVLILLSSLGIVSAAVAL